MNKEFFEAYKKLQGRIKTIAPNEKGFNYNYADLDAVWGMVRNAIAEEGFIVINSCVEKGIETRLIHESEHEEKSTMPWTTEILSKKKDGQGGVTQEKKSPMPQDRGSEITYARRYNLLCLLQIVVKGEDNDANYNK